MAKGMFVLRKINSAEEERKKKKKYKKLVVTPTDLSIFPRHESNPFWRFCKGKNLFPDCLIFGRTAQSQG